MTTRHDSAPSPSAPMRALALLLAWLVFGLTLASVSPTVHALAHGGVVHSDAAHDAHHETPADDAGHHCAVVLYAHGATLPLVAVELPRPPAAWREVAPAGQRPLFLTAPRYLRHPERGPPVVLA